MTTAILETVKSMVVRIENIIDTKIISMLIEAVEFLALLTLPILLPFGIMILSCWSI